MNDQTVNEELNEFVNDERPMRWYEMAYVIATVIFECRVDPAKITDEQIELSCISCGAFLGSGYDLAGDLMAEFVATVRRHILEFQTEQ